MVMVEAFRLVRRKDTVTILATSTIRTTDNGWCDEGTVDDGKFHRYYEDRC